MLGFINSRFSSPGVFTQCPQTPLILRMEIVASFPCLLVSHFLMGEALDQQLQGHYWHSSERLGLGWGSCGQLPRGWTDLHAEIQEQPGQAIAGGHKNHHQSREWGGGRSEGMEGCCDLKKPEKGQVEWRPRAPSYCSLPAHSESLPCPCLKGNTLHWTIPFRSFLPPNKITIYAFPMLVET